ncbi:hypothetical protein NW762_010194 [Fusarium torreyae]|uniref:AB hydrolase-1 domain-containing protein n=1 Tax=Fusarium torreyae TaxID=1237075 RepID=A0A9W8VDF1_9HYPO|nr:hypothetical protein NW762_010194 [Fusarium torreyae]
MQSEHPNTNELVSHGDHFFEAEGIRFHYFVRGSGPLMIFQSVGWGVSGGFLWNSLGPHMEKNNTVLYLEPRGNGQSSKPSDPATMCAKTMAEDLDHLRKHLQLEAFPILGGGSHSGAIVLRYAERYPHRVRKLILISSQTMDSPPNTHMNDWIAKRKDDPRFRPALGKLMELFSGKMPETDEQFAADFQVILPYYFSDPSRADVLKQSLEKDGDLPSVYGLQTNVNDAKEENKLPHVAEAGSVTAKTLIIWGAEDALCSLTAANALADGIPDSRLVVIPGAGHCSWIEKPDDFWRAFDAFIAE